MSPLWSVLPNTECGTQRLQNEWFVPKGLLRVKTGQVPSLIGRQGALSSGNRSAYEKALVGKDNRVPDGLQGK